MLEAAGGNGGGVSSSLTDAIGIGTLTRLVSRELVDEVVASLGRKELRKNKLPARVMVYFVMAMALFYADGYEEVMRKLTAGLQYLGTWRRDWKMPSPGALCQARQRLGLRPVIDPPARPPRIWRLIQRPDLLCEVNSPRQRACTEDGLFPERIGLPHVILQKQAIKCIIPPGSPATR